MKRFVDKLYSSFFLAVALFPLFMVPGYYLAPDEPAAWFLACGIAVVPGAVTVLVPGRWRIPWMLLSATAMGLAFPPAMLPGIVVALGMALASTRREPGAEWPPAFWLAALGVGLAGQAWVHIVVTKDTAAAGLVPWLKGAFALYVGLFILHMNRTSLVESLSRVSGQLPPRAIRVRNRLLSLACVALLYLAASWRALADAVGRCARGLARLIAAFVGWLSRLFISEEKLGAASPAARLESGMLPPGESAPFWLFLEKVVMVLAAVAAVCLAGLLAVRLVRGVKKLCRWLRQKFWDTAAALGENYQSRTESIFDWNEVKLSAMDRLRAMRPVRVRSPRWADMDNRQRVRHAYQVLLRRHPDMPAAMTARQALEGHVLISPEEDGAFLADAYDAARYSDWDLTGRQAEAMRQAARLGRS